MTFEQRIAAILEQIGETASGLPIAACELAATQAQVIAESMPHIILNAGPGLDWNVTEYTTYKAESWCGVYTVYPNSAGSWTLDDGAAVSAHDGPAEAKIAAAKEDTRRVLEMMGLTS